MPLARSRNGGTLAALHPNPSLNHSIMGQQLNKIVKRRRRKKYLERKKALAKAGVTRKARAAKVEKVVKKAPAKKSAAKKSAAKKVDAAPVEAAPVAEAPAQE